MRRITIIYPDGVPHNVIATRVDVTLDGNILLTYFDNGVECFTEIVNVNGTWCKSPGITYFPSVNELRPYDPMYSNNIIYSLPNVMHSISNILSRTRPVAQPQMAQQVQTVDPPPPYRPKEKEVIRPMPKKPPKEKALVEEINNTPSNPVFNYYVVLYDDGQYTYFHELQNLIDDLNNNRSFNTYPIYEYELNSRKDSYEFNDALYSIKHYSDNKTYLRMVARAISRVIELNRIRKHADRIKEISPSVNIGGRDFTIRVNFAYCIDEDFYQDVVSRSAQIIPDENHNQISPRSYESVRVLLEYISNEQLKANFIDRNGDSVKGLKENQDNRGSHR